MKAHIESEIGRLHAVLLGSIANFTLFPPINAVQRHYFPTDPPQRERLIAQQEQFVRVLQQYSVALSWAAPRDDAPGQFYTRDIATVVGDTFVVCAMKESIRQPELRGLEPMLARLETPVVYAEGGLLEGGDVLLDGNTLFVGLSERTNQAGIDWIEQQFGPRFAIVPISLTPPFIHLDIVFNRVGRTSGLVYPAGIANKSLELLRQRYDLIEVTQDEQFTGAVNVLSLSPEDVVTDQRHARVHALLRERGLNVVTVDFSEFAKLGGMFRCGTCPLVRDLV